MAITMPTPNKVRPAYDYRPAIAGVQGAAMTVPSPVAISTTVRADGMPVFVPCVGANNAAYIGFAVVPKSIGDGIGALRDTVLTGIEGMTAGAEVYLDATTGALTHTSTSNGAAIGKALTTKLLYIY